MEQQLQKRLPFWGPAFLVECTLTYRSNTVPSVSMVQTILSTGIVHVGRTYLRAVVCPLHLSKPKLAFRSNNGHEKESRSFLKIFFGKFYCNVYTEIRVWHRLKSSTVAQWKSVWRAWLPRFNLNASFLLQDVTAGTNSSLVPRSASCPYVPFPHFSVPLLIHLCFKTIPPVGRLPFLSALCPGAVRKSCLLFELFSTRGAPAELGTQTSFNFPWATHLLK